MSVVNHSYRKVTFVCFKIDQVGSIPDWCESSCDHNILDHSEPPGGSQAVDHLFFFSSKKIIYRVTVWPDRYFSNVGPFVGFLPGDLLPLPPLPPMYLPYTQAQSSLGVMHHVGEDFTIKGHLRQLPPFSQKVSPNIASSSFAPLPFCYCP